MNEDKLKLHYFKFNNLSLVVGFPDSSVVKNLPTNVGDGRGKDSIPQSGRSPAGGNGNSLQYSSLENPTDRRVWQATVHGVAKELDTTEQLHFNFTNRHCSFL